MIWVARSEMIARQRIVVASVTVAAFGPRSYRRRGTVTEWVVPIQVLSKPIGRGRVKRAVSIGDELVQGPVLGLGD